MFRVNFLTFSAALGIVRTSSALHSLARKFVKFVGKKRSFSTDVWRRLGIIQVNLASALALHKRSFISRRVYYKSLNFSVLSSIATKRTCQGRLKGNLLPICRPCPPRRRDTAEMPRGIIPSPCSCLACRFSLLWPTPYGGVQR